MDLELQTTYNSVIYPSINVVVNFCSFVVPCVCIQIVPCTIYMVADDSIVIFISMQVLIKGILWGYGCGV